MTPKEKSIQLIRKYSNIDITVCNFDLKRFGNEIFYHTDRLIAKSAKDCALIAVDEILSLLPLVNREYWEEVKQEIEKF